MGNTDEDAEFTADWQSRQPRPAPPAAPPGSAPQAPPHQQPTAPPSWGVPPAPPGQPPQPFGAPPPTGPPPFSPPPTNWAAAPPGSWPGAGHGAPSPKKSPVLAIVAVAVVVAVALAAAVFYVLRDDAGDRDTTPAAAPTSGKETVTPSGTTSAPTSPSRTTSTPGTTPAAPTMSQGTLAGLLSSPADLAKFANGDAMTPDPLASAPFTGLTVDPSNCTGAVAPGASTSYNGSGYTSFAGQAAADASGQHKVIQAVAAFSTPADATSFYDNQVKGWRGCHYKTLTLTTSDGAATQTKSGVVGETDGTATLLLFSAGSTGRDCERGLSARNNVVVDVRVCSPKVGSGGYTLARDIGQRITGRR